MPKFGQYTEETSPSNDDLVIIKENASGASKRVQLQNLIPTGSVTSAKLASGAVTSAKLAPSKTTDANGWTIYDYGTWKEYMKILSQTGLSDVIGNGQTRTTGSANLPVGFTDLTSCFFQSTVSVNEAFLWTTDQTTPTSTAFTGAIVNLSASNRTRTFTHAVYRILK